nr:MAG TPA: hypothetical protein [Caudoviricetes sp.]
MFYKSIHILCRRQRSKPLGLALDIYIPHKTIK